jgi:hypothetical protein
LNCHYPNVQSASTPATHVQLTPEASSASPEDVNDHGQSNVHFGRTPRTTDEMTLDFDSNQEDQALSLPAFPDYELDWTDIMTNIDSFLVPDQMETFGPPKRSVLAGEIYQERIVYCVRRLKEFPSLLVRQGSTPFIHHSLYAGNIPMMMQDALGICSLYGQKGEQNAALVFRAISHKASRLVEDYSSIGASPMDQLAAVQALTLYQIIRLFDGDIRQRADAERADVTLNAWTNQLKLRMQPLGGDSSPQSDQVQTLLTPTATTDSWRSWIFAESLRRTLIASFSVQGLYCFLKNGSDDSHHDFADLSFYAQQALWNAPSEHYWRLAVEEKSTLPLRFSHWDEDIADAEPADIEILGMIMMALVKGVDYCQKWVGQTQELQRFGLAMY